MFKRRRWFIQLLLLEIVNLFSTENVAGSPPQSYHQPYSDTSHQSSSSSRRASLLNHDQNLTQSSGGGPEPLRVLMLGTSGVGKTALTAQFMTSEYLNTYEASLGIICFSIFYEGAHRGIFDRFQSVLYRLGTSSTAQGKRKQDKHQESLLFY